MSWNSKLGIWSWWIFRGTTPRNAGVWTLDVIAGDRELWIGTGPHAYITYFKGPEEKWSVERETTDCNCYGCSMSNWTVSPEVAKAMAQTMDRIDHVIRKLPPLGCQPTDCCGDEEAHND